MTTEIVNARSIARKLCASIYRRYRPSSGGLWLPFSRPYCGCGTIGRPYDNADTASLIVGPQADAFPHSARSQRRWRVLSEPHGQPRRELFGPGHAGGGELLDGDRRDEVAHHGGLW